MLRNGAVLFVLGIMGEVLLHKVQTSPLREVGWQCHYVRATKGPQGAQFCFWFPQVLAWFQKMLCVITSNFIPSACTSIEST